MNKKVIVPLLVTPMLLSSCNEVSFIGKYSFRMGKENDSHIGIVLELTEKDYEKDPSLGKEFTLTLESQIGAKKKETHREEPDTSSSEDEGGEGEGESSSSEEPAGIDNLFGGGDFSLSGYYNIGNTKSKDGYYPLVLAANILDPEEYEMVLIPDEVVADIVVAEINKTSIQATIPVSISDLMYQLYWYGWDVSIDIETFVIEIKKSSGESHEHGTHPTQEDIDRINQTFPDEHLGFEFKDFDCLTMGLTKEQ